MKKRKKVQGVMRIAEPICDPELDDGLDRPDPVAGRVYILGHDGNYYRVSEEEEFSLIVREDIEWGRLEGLSVAFETPVIQTGKFQWAYRIRLAREVIDD